VAQELVLGAERQAAVQMVLLSVAWAAQQPLE
jgi:hypothetical protein